MTSRPSVDLQEQNLQPELKHVVPVVHLYAAAGQYDQARKLISDISREHAAVLNIAVYNAFLKVGVHCQPYKVQLPVPMLALMEDAFEKRAQCDVEVLYSQRTFASDRMLQWPVCAKLQARHDDL